MADIKGYILVLVLALSPSINAVADGDCVQDSVLAPLISISAGGIEEGSLDPSYCMDMCNILEHKYAAINGGKFCFCFDDDSGMTTVASSTCDATCSDGSSCGGLELGIFTVWESKASGGTIIISVDPLMLSTTDVVEAVIVNTTASWLIDWGDGADHVVNATTHTYTLPGVYAIKAYLEPFPYVSDTHLVEVYEAPNASLTCPENVKVHENITCELVTVSQGQDYSLTREFTEPGIPTEVFDIPSELSSLHGSILGSATLETPTAISTGDIIILETNPANKGQIARVEVNAATSGWVTIYGVKPGCDAGVYCWGSNNCNTACSANGSPLTCSADTFCATYGQCTASSCSGSTATNANFAYRVITTFYVDTTGTPFTYLHDYLSASVHDGERIAIGCAEAADCSSAHATINTRNASLSESKDQLATSTGTGVASAGSFSTLKHLVRVLVRDDPIVYLSYDINCTTASSIPTANVPTPFDATTEEYVLKGHYNLTYTMTSTHLGSPVEWKGEASTRCQEEVLAPTLELELWVPLDISTPYPILFAQGAPIFVTLNLGPVTEYDYKDNATDYLWSVPLLYSATGDYNVEGNVSNALNWETFTSVIHVVPIVTDTWTAEAHCLCLDWDEGFGITISFPSAPNPPFSGNLTATYSGGDLMPLQVLDFGTSTNAGVAEPLDINFNVTLMEVGNHTITFFLINEVSNTTFTLDVEVNEKITDVTSEMNWMDEGVMMPGLGDFQNSFMANETVIFTASTGTGNAEKWKLSIYPSGEVLLETTDSNATLPYIFLNEAEYNLTMSAYNPVQGWIDSDPFEMIVLTEITGYELTDDGALLKPNETKIVTASFEILPPVSCVMIDYGDNSPVETHGYRSNCISEYPDALYVGPLSNPHDFEHKYIDEGLYTVTAFAFDKRISQKLDLGVVIADMPCNMPEVDILDRVMSPGDAPAYWKSLKFFLTTTAVIDCNISVPVDRWWTITEVTEDRGSPVRDVFVRGVLGSWNFSQITIPSLFLDYGFYEFTYFLRVNASKVIPLQRNVRTYIEIIPTPLSGIMIDGSMSSVSRGFGQKLFLNPKALSIDPDFPLDKNFNVTWWCRQLVPTAETFEEDLEGNPIVHNMQAVPPPLEAVQAGLTGGGCYGVGPGTLDLVGGSFEFMMQSFVNPTATYEIVAKVTKDSREAFARIEIVVTQGNPPTINIRCVDDDLCTPYQGALLVNPSSRLALKGECKLDCSEIMNYMWNVTDINGNNVNEEAEQDCTSDVNATSAVLSSPDCEEVFMTPKDGIDLAIGSIFFSINPNLEKFKFRLTGENTDTLTRGHAETLIVLNKPPALGTCTLNGNEGLALVDEFEASCVDWVDPENMGITIYAFYTNSNGTAGNIKATMVASPEKTVQLVFPVGYFEVRAEIWDIFGGYTDVHIGFIELGMPTKEEVDNYNTSTVLQYLTDAGDQTKMAMVLVASGSIRENADWLSLNVSSFGNMTEEEMVDRLKEIAAMNLDSLKLASGTMNFASLPQINVGAEVLQSALDGVLGNDLAALTVDMETRETALDFLDKMTSQLDEVTVSSPQELVPFVSKSMTSISALMTGINNIIDNPELVPPTDQEAAVDWDYNVDIDVGDDYKLVVPLDRESQLKQNVLDTTRLNAKYQVDRMMSIVDTLSQKVQDKCVIGETVAAQTDSGAAIIMAKVTEEILRDGLEIDPQDGKNASVKFPVNFCPSRYNTPSTDCKQELGITTVVWPTVTHIYPDSTALLTKKTRVLDISVTIRGSRVDVTNESLPITIEIPRSPETIEDAVIVNTSDSMSSLLPIVYHQFTIDKEYSAYTIDITPVDDMPSQMIIMLDHERMPTPSKFDIIKLVQDLPLNANGSFTLFINSRENDNKMGRFFAGMAVLKDNVNIDDIYNGKNLTTSDLLNFTSRYSFRTYSSGCYYYDPITERWTGEGLYVVEATETKTVCDTIHLTPFGSGHFAVPNTIDFSYVFANTGFSNNLTLYLVLIILSSCYIIMMIWARFTDKKDIEYRGVEPLEDNKIEDKYLYEITITTGPDQEAGTDSNIEFLVSGDFNETDVRILPPSQGRRYHRYCVDAFVMAVPAPLGDIDYLRIWHDNSGKTPFDGWQCQSVVIRDLQTREKFIFRMDAWLAFDRSGTVDVIFKTSQKMFDSFARAFYLKGNRSSNNDNMWMSIFLRPTGSRFSRKERVSIGALFLYLSLLINALWYQRLEDSPRSGLFEFGPVTLSLEQLITGLISGCIVYPVTLLLIVIFKRARPYRLKKCRALEAISKQRREGLEAEQLPVPEDPINMYDTVESSSAENPSKDENNVKCIPWWTRWIAWIIILAGLAASIFFVWSYGIMWGEIKTVKWFSSFIFSFFISVLIVQWLNVLIITTAGAACCRGQDITIEDIDCDEELPHLNYDEEWKNVKPMDPSERKKLHSLGGVDPTEPYIASLVVRLTKRREMLFVLRDIGAYCLFLIVLSLMVSGRTDPNMFLLQTQMTNSFIKIGHKDLDFSTKIITADHLWLWIQEVVMKEIRAQRRYNNEPPYGLRGYLGDLNNRLMGYGILRQVRVDPRKCKVIKPLDQIIDSCSGPRSPALEDQRDFCNSWSILDSGNSLMPCEHDEFIYKTADELQTYSQVGKLGEYGGGGYIIRLKGSQDDIQNRFKLLQSIGWIDRYTRAVILEFSTFNVNVNLFATGSVMAEFNEGGGITPKWRFDPLSLLSDSTIVFLAECTFVICTVLFTLNELWKIKKLKCNYFTSYWNIAEVCILLVSYCCIGVYIYRYFLTKAAIDKFTKTYGNGYVRLDSAALMDQAYLYMMALVVFFSILKLIKLLQFNKRMDVLALTIRLCWDELKVFFCAFGIVFFAFCCMFYFIFLTAIENFAKFISAVETSFKMMLGKFDFEEMNRANPISPLLFFVFSVMNSMILINIMLTIILRAFNEVKVELEKKENKYDIIDFVHSAFRRKLKLEKPLDNSVQPNIEEKSQRNGSGLLDKKAEQLPDKVSQLMTYISDTYFEGKVNLNDPAAVKKIMQTTVPSAGRRPFTSSRLNMTLGQRQVISSD